MTELPNRLLREALREKTPAAFSTTCVDAGTLAAWADATLSSASRAAFERHAADCARCQALMAAMVRSEPAPEIRAAWWRRSPVSWLMPLAAAAAAIVLVVDLTVTERRAGVPPVVGQEAPVTSVVPAPPPVAQAAPPPDGGGVARPGADSNRDSTAAISRKSPPRAPGSLADAAAEAPAGERRAKAVVEPAQPVPVPAPTPIPTPALVPAPSPAAAPSAPPQAAAKDLTAAPPAAAAMQREEITRPEAMANRAAAAVMAKPAQSPAPTIIASPDRDWQWRIVDGEVEQTHDAGRTWQPQALGESHAVRAGAAPAAHVCWLVGARGVVLLTTDGTTWRRIAFPEPFDLVAVQAGDAARATVTTATARRYATSDGGQTWTLVQLTT